MAEPSLAVWDAVYDLLSDNLSCEVYDYVPNSATMPYVVMAGLESTVADSLSTRRETCLLKLEVKSVETGQFELLGLLGEIDAILHDASPDLSTGRAVSVRISKKETSWDADAALFLAKVTVKCVLEH